MSAYRLYDLVLAAACELPELDRTEAPPDLTLILAALPPSPDGWEDLWLLEDGAPWVQVQRLDQAYRIRYVDQVEFEYSRPERRIVADIIDCPAPTFRHFLLDQVVPFILGHDALVLHASAAVIGDRLIAFVGKGGAGKSTLTALLEQRGHAIAADDGLLIRRDADGFIGVPPYRGLRLWPETLGMLPRRAVHGPVSAESSKRRVCEGFRLDDRPRRIGSLFVLDDSESAGIAVEALTGRGRIVALLEHSFCLERHAGRHLVEHMERVCAAAAVFRAWRLRYPRRQDCWPALIDAIEARTMSSASGLAGAAT